MHNSIIPLLFANLFGKDYDWVMDQHYKGVIWTNHALDRLKERRIDQSTAYDVFAHPDDTQKNWKQDSTEFKKRFGPQTISVIANKNTNGEWVVISVWVDPPLPGTKDAKQKALYLKYRNAGFWGKMWYLFLRQIGF